ncbi:hypothetical protein JOC75_000658 [Metabacillus crassostreae]|nr:hypothetical protein [Metabacillus crassostreae]MBM7602688.1 hypothetical protein [Metabacillus crassostreae]
MIHDKKDKFLGDSEKKKVFFDTDWFIFICVLIAGFISVFIIK